MLWCRQTIPESKPFQTQSTCICLFIPNRSLDRNREIIRTLLLLFKSNDRFGLKMAKPFTTGFGLGHLLFISDVLFYCHFLAVVNIDSCGSWLC